MYFSHSAHSSANSFYSDQIDGLTKRRRSSGFTLLIEIPLAIVVVNAAQTTSAEEEERPALLGMVPSINTFIPRSSNRAIPARTNVSRRTFQFLLRIFISNALKATFEILEPTRFVVRNVQILNIKRCRSRRRRLSLSLCVSRRDRKCSLRIRRIGIADVNFTVVGHCEN